MLQALTSPITQDDAIEKTKENKIMKKKDSGDKLTPWQESRPDAYRHKTSGTLEKLCLLPCKCIPASHSAHPHHSITFPRPPWQQAALGRAELVLLETIKRSLNELSKVRNRQPNIGGQALRTPRPPTSHFIMKQLLFITHR